MNQLWGQISNNIIRVIKMDFPEAPDKDRIVELLSKTHVPGITNWTTAEQQEAYLALRALSFLWFRTEDTLTPMEIEYDSSRKI